MRKKLVFLILVFFVALGITFGGYLSDESVALDSMTGKTLAGPYPDPEPMESTIITITDFS